MDEGLDEGSDVPLGTLEFKSAPWRGSSAATNSTSACFRFLYGTRIEGASIVSGMTRNVPVGDDHKSDLVIYAYKFQEIYF